MVGHHDHAGLMMMLAIFSAAGVIMIAAGLMIRKRFGSGNEKPGGFKDWGLKPLGVIQVGGSALILMGAVAIAVAVSFPFILRR